MSRQSNNKKSTNKYRKFKVSPLIPVIAVVEVIVLIAISTYAWFVVAQEKEASTGVITVNADSGLDIDFKNANYNDEINVWDYVDDEFSFEPVTSLDGRNVYVPTSGTFEKTSTNEMFFRDATINDINDKYLNVDFMLTNTTEADMEVYLGNDSRFKVWKNNVDSNSRALRLAFYTNDGEHGKVDSSILANTNNENAIIAQSSNTWTVYFKNTRNWGDVYAYMWTNTNDYAVSWPGSKMTRIAGDIYSYTFNNPSDAPYTKIIFNNGDKNGTVGTNQTTDLTLTGNNSKLFNMDGSTETYTTKTCYFFKPSGWSGVKAHAFVATGDDRSLTTYPGDDCVDCGAGIYSYTFPTSTKINGTSVNLNKIIFSNSSNSGSKTADLTADNGALYFSNSPANRPSGGYDVYSEKTIYFYNSQSFEKPYAKVTGSGQTFEIPMTNLSAGIFYCTVPSIYSTVVFEDGKGASQNTKYTQSSNIQNGYIYRPNLKTGSGWTISNYSYEGYVGTTGQEPYAVISPGVSAGFQRAYTPVVDIASANGSPTQLIPAFASSIDNYIKGSGNALFTIPAGGMKDLSMIIWLEGTDADCTNDNYASTTLSKKEIELYLEFATTNVYRDSDNVQRYTYRFYDKTREVWTSDRLTNDAGISIAPVMQLYDATDKRGYLMHAASTTSAGGKKKIDLWECQAPSTLYSSRHDLYFRRVDPYDEDEVWNYWHPGAPVSDAASTVNGKQYISFTAFADGAPASSNADATGVNGNDSVLDAATTAETPAKSCGGLWGTYETTLLTVVDNTYNNNTHSHWLSADGGVVTIKYSYKYPTSGSTQAIEYKASGPYHDQLYYFVVPKRLVEDGSSRASSYTFHRFWGFNNSYAMNIYKRNSSMSYNNTGTATINSAMTGYYAWLGQSAGATNINQYWFGDALNYINISYKDEGNNKDIFGGTEYGFKVGIWKTGASDVICLYKNNGDFQLSNFNGYLMVAPHGYTNFQLRRVKTSSWNGTVYNYSDTYSVSNRNLVAYYWSSDTIKGSSNNNQGEYNWPTVPAYE